MPQQINIVLLGMGNVGSTLISQVLESQHFFLCQHNIELRFPVIANSTLAFFEKDGIKNKWEVDFERSAIPFKIEDIIDYVKNQEFESLIAVDASEFRFGQILHSADPKRIPYRCRKQNCQYAALRFLCSASKKPSGIR